MQATKYITDLEEQVTAAERQVADTQARLERLRLKLEVAREVAAELEVSPKTDPRQPNIAPPVNGDGGAAGKYRGLPASEAILRFLGDHGPASRTLILDTLSPQIKTSSGHPRNIVRNCMIQLAERGKIALGQSGTFTLKPKVQETQGEQP